MHGISRSAALAMEAIFMSFLFCFVLFDNLMQQTALSRKIKLMPFSLFL